VTIFTDRVDAGTRLASALEHLRAMNAVVLGIPRGGVVVAAAVARTLDLPLAAVAVRKLGAPRNPEFAVGAIADGVRVIDRAAVQYGGVTPEQLAFIEDLERVELDRRRRAFDAASVVIGGRTAVVVDDGIATGSTMTAACHSVRERGAARIVVAVPVAPHDWHPDGVVDEYVCPHREQDFWAVGQFYADFTQTTDEEVARLLSSDLL
jgi:putative phosphoribosyl transferase